MIEYEVRDIVCDYGVYENGELKLILNSKRIALQIVELLKEDEQMHRVLNPVKNYPPYLDRPKYTSSNSDCSDTAEYITTDQVQDCLDELTEVKAPRVVTECRNCKHGRNIDKTRSPEKYFNPEYIICECEDVVGEESMLYPPNHFCSYGVAKKD